MGYSLVLSGQGTEKCGMLRDVIGQNLYAQEVVEKATKLLGVDFLKIIASNESSVISDTRFNQILIFMFHEIYSRLIIEKIGAEPEFVMGHSLGQLCAYSVAGVASVDDMLNYIKIRTDIINDKSIDVEAKFINCFGLTYSTAKIMIKENGLGDEVKIGLHNQENNVVLAVTNNVKSKIVELSNKYKFITKEMTVARPYHTSFMKKYNDKLLTPIEELNLNNAKIPILLNHSCKLEQSAEKIKIETKKQMIETVYWYKSLANSYSENYIVLDPSMNQVKILRKIVKGKVVGIVNYASLKNLSTISI